MFQGGLGYNRMARSRQVHFSSMIDDGLVSEIRRTADWLRSRGMPVVYTQHGHVDPLAEETTDVLVAWWGAAGSIKCASVPPGFSASVPGIITSLIYHIPGMYHFPWYVAVF